jgi:glycosyltransferase involved in cell wall biosynthesis
MADVSIVIPTRNRRDLLMRAVDSVQEQSFPNWECIVVDDGSDDATSVAMSDRTAADARISYVQRTGGQSGANACRNLGVLHAQSDLVVFLDSDDVLAPNCLERRVAVMRENPQLAFSVFDGAVFRDAPGDLGRNFDAHAGEDLDRFLSLYGPWDTTAPIWRRDFLQRIGGWDENLMSWQDIDLSIRALSRAPSYLRFRVVDHHIRWAATGERISHRKAFDIGLNLNCAGCPKKWRDLLLEGAMLSESRQKLIAGALFHLCGQLAWMGRYRKAVSLWNSASDLDVPWHVQVPGIVVLATMLPSFGKLRVAQSAQRRWKTRQGFVLSPRPAGAMAERRLGTANE